VLSDDETSSIAKYIMLPNETLGMPTKQALPKAKGMTSYLAHLKGKTNTQRQAIEAYCYDCMGFYEDGIADCQNPKCPLYPFMPYNPLRSAQRAAWGKK